MIPSNTQNTQQISPPTYIGTLRRNRLSKISFLLVMLGGLFGLSACDTDKVLGLRTDSVLNFGFNTGVTPEAHSMRVFWTWTVLTSLVIGGAIWFFIAYIMVRYRQKSDSPAFPKQVGYISILETTYTIFPIIVVLCIFFFTVKVDNVVTKIEANPPVVVDVTAFKWNWKFGYNTINLDGYSYSGIIDPDHPEDKNPYEGMTPEDIEKQREARLRQNQAHGNEISLSQLKLDEIETIGTTTEVPVLVLPVNTRVEFRLASADVVHSFYVPEFLFKRDVFPFPHAEHVQFRFQITKIDRPGAFVGRCAEMCGEYHSAMNFEIRAVNKEDFVKYIKARRLGYSNAQALMAIHSSGVATVTKPFKS